jgi:DNA topoisomerase-3
VSELEFKVYELITRHFLACCSKDAKGYETKVQMMVRDESFHTSGLVILEKNYLEIYPYENWNAHTIPNFRVKNYFLNKLN